MPTKRKVRKRPDYSDEFRATAVAALYAAGYPNVKGALAKVSAQFSIPGATLYRWVSGLQNPPPYHLEQVKKADLADTFEEVAHLYLEHAKKEDVIRRTSGQSAVVASATAVDKMRLLRGLPTELVQFLPTFVAAANKANVPPMEILQNAYNALVEQTAEAEK